MAENDFLVWAGGSNANVLTQAAYVALPNLTSGDVAGKASAQQANKTWRQASIIATTIAQFIADTLGVNVIDDGTTATIEANFIAAIKQATALNNTGVTPGTYGPTVSLTVEADGRITALQNANLQGTGLTPGTYVAPTITVGADGRISGITSVAYGAIGSANSWTQTNTFQAGIDLTGADNGGISAGFQWRAVQGNFGAGFRNDGTSAYLLQTASGQPNGSWNALRPFSWNLTTGQVTIDGTGAGITCGGNVLAGFRLRASLGAYASGDANAATILNDFNLQATGNDTSSYLRLPNGWIVQTAHGATVSGQGDIVTFPNPFPTACVQVLAHEGAPGGWTETGPITPTIFGTQELTRTNFALYCVRQVANSPTWNFAPTIEYRYIAIGY